MSDTPMTADQLVHQIATLRDLPAGNELFALDAPGMLQAIIDQARLICGLPEFVAPEPSSRSRAIIEEALRRTKE